MLLFLKVRIYYSIPCLTDSIMQEHNMSEQVYIILSGLLLSHWQLGQSHIYLPLNWIALNSYRFRMLWWTSCLMSSQILIFLGSTVPASFWWVWCVTVLYEADPPSLWNLILQVTIIALSFLNCQFKTLILYFFWKVEHYWNIERKQKVQF